MSSPIAAVVVKAVAKANWRIDVVGIGGLGEIQTSAFCATVVAIDKIGDEAGEYNFAEPGIAVAMSRCALWTRSGC